MRQTTYYVTGRSRLTGEDVILTPPCSRDVAERALLRAQRYNNKEAAYVQLRLTRSDVRQLYLDFGDDAPLDSDAPLDRVSTHCVYPIVNGCSTDAAFAGTLRECQAYAANRRRDDADFECIILLDDDDCHATADDCSSMEGCASMEDQETLLFDNGIVTATVTTDGHTNVVEVTGTAPLTFAKLSTAIAHLEARGYRILTSW